MVRKIMRNPMFLAQKCEPATEKDAQIAQDLLDILRDNTGLTAESIQHQIDHCNGIVI